MMIQLRHPYLMLLVVPLLAGGAVVAQTLPESHPLAPYCWAPLSTFVVPSVVMKDREFQVEYVDAIIRVMPNGDVRDVRITRKSQFEGLNAISIAKLERLSCRPVPAIVSEAGAEYPITFLYHRYPIRDKLSPPMVYRDMPEQWRWCVGMSVPSDQRIRGCTTIIEGGHESTENLAVAYLERAGAYRVKGDGNYDQAIQDYEQVIKLAPRNPEAFQGLGNTYLRKREFEWAKTNFDQAIQIDSQSASFLNSRCWVQMLIGHLDEALADCNESLRLRPLDPNTLDSRGLVHLKGGHLDSAVADYDEALRLRPKYASAMYGRGIAKLRKGDKTAGAADMAAAKASQADIAEKFAEYGVAP